MGKYEGNSGFQKSVSLDWIEEEKVGGTRSETCNLLATAIW